MQNFKVLVRIPEKRRRCGQLQVDGYHRGLAGKLCGLHYSERN